MTSPVNESCRPEHTIPVQGHSRCQRLFGMILRHIYLLAGSWPRLIDLIYWPSLNMLIWGFLNKFMAQQQTTTAGIVIGLILGAAMMWDILLRSQMSLFQSFMEEIWSRNFGHVFVSPMTPLEYIASLVLLSFLRVIIAMTPCTLFAYLFFHFWLPGLGLPALGYALNLAITGWWGGMLIIAMLFRFGYAAEWLAWMAMFIMLPLVAVYYPVTVLPDWLQNISWLLPPTYVFEGLRALMRGDGFDPAMLVRASGLNLVYLCIGFAVFYRSFEATRREGGLLQAGE